MKNYLIRIHTLLWHTCFVQNIEIVYLYSFANKVILLDGCNSIYSTCTKSIL